MATEIHPTAVVEAGAQLGVDVTVGPLAYVGAEAQLGDGCRLHHHAAVEGNTVLGASCEIYPFANIGGKTQDLKYQGGSPGVRIGERNVFREYVTIHTGTAADSETVLGDDNKFLAQCHVAHDCVIGSHVIASNNTLIGGHCIVEDHVVFGGFSGVHQFCRIGAHAMISAYTKIVQDIPPYMLADGQPAIIRAINRVGLERRGFEGESLDRIKRVFRIMFRDGLNRSQAIEKLKAHDAVDSAEFRAVLDFAAASERGLAPGA
jgi:UDP-N-acetylglucosamine acyltransferase